MKKLAYFGGEATMNEADVAKMRQLCAWPIYTKEDEDAALDVIRKNNFSGTDITEAFEKEFAAWIGTDFAVAYTSGTMSLAAAMFAIGLSRGDEIICTTKTYWASIAQAYSFGATPVFCNIDDMLSMDPDDLERVISPKTKAIMVVHYISYPCDMDRIMAIAKKYNLKVIEDVSHAQGGLYKGKRLGTFGDIAAMSLMSQKSFAAGELGVVVTNDRKLYERTLAYGHYNRLNAAYVTESQELIPYYHMPLGAVKGRANQLCCAIARVQLKYYDERCVEIRKAMNYFLDLIEDLPGLLPIRVDESTGSNMAGFYAINIRYLPEQLGGLSVKTFIEALNAELGGAHRSRAGANNCLHTHEYFKTFDFFGSGTPSRIENADRDVRLMDAVLDSAEDKICITIPWLKKYDKEIIEKLAQGYRNVVQNHQQLLALEQQSNQQRGVWYGEQKV